MLHEELVPRVACVALKALVGPLLLRQVHLHVSVVVSDVGEALAAQSARVPVCVQQFDVLL